MRPHSPSVVPRAAAGMDSHDVTCDAGRPSSNFSYQFHRLIIIIKYIYIAQDREKLQMRWNENFIYKAQVNTPKNRPTWIQ